MVILVTLTLIYILIIIYFIRKWKDIFTNSEKYDEISGWKKYQNSYWYEPLSQYRNSFFSKNHIAPILVDIPLFLILFAGAYSLAKILQSIFFIPDEVIIQLQINEFPIGLCGILFFSIILSLWTCYNSKIPIFIAATMTAFNSDRRSTDWKKLIVSLTVVFAIAFPFYILSVNTYGYITEEKVVFNAYFDIIENEFYYDDIIRTETTVRSCNDKSKYYFSYIITNSRGESVDVFNQTFKTDKGFTKPLSLKSAQYVYDALKDRNVPILKSNIDDELYQSLKNTCYPTSFELISNLYSTSS